MRLALAVLLWAAAFDALACSCAGPGTPARALAQSDAVFLARVVHTEILTTRLTVLKTWKGSVPTTIDVGGDACGYRGWVEGREFLVYASSPQRVVTMCSRTHPAAEAQLEMRLLDALRAGEKEEVFLARIAPAMLNEPRAEGRAEAVRLVARDAPREVALAGLPTFVRALRDSSPLVRKEVVAALDRGPWIMQENLQRTVLDALIDAIDDRDPAIRAQAASALAKSWSVPGAEAALLAALDVERDRTVISSIASTLAGVGSPVTKRRVVPLLVRDLQSSEAAVRQNAAERLGHIGADARVAAEPLAAALRDSEDWVRYYAAGALGSIGARDAVPQLVVALDDKKPDVRAQAAWAIFMTGDDAAVRSSAIPALIRSLETAKDFERYHLYRVIGEIGPSAHTATPVLARLLGTAHSWEHVPIVNALHGIGPRAARAVPALVFALARANQETALPLLQALEAIDDRSAEVVRGVEARLQDGDEATRSAAAVLLAKWRVPAGSAYVAQKVVPALVEQLANPATRRDALYRLDTLGDLGASATAAVPVLRGMLGVAETRREAAFALGTIGRASASAVPELIALLRDPEPWTRVSAAEALRKIGTSEARRAFDAFAPGEVATLAKQLRETEGRERGEVARYLVHLAPHTATAMPALIDALSDRDWLARTKSAEALGALGALAAPATAALTRALDDRNAYVRNAAAAALKQIAQ